MTSILARLAATGAAAAGTVAARRGAEQAWRATRGQDPPDASAVAEDDTGLRDLLLWSLVLAGSVSVARRLAASATRKAFDRA